MLRRHLLCVGLASLAAQACVQPAQLTECLDGQRLVCPCNESVEGTQRCLSGAWGPCDCPPAPVDAAVDEDLTPNDTGTMDSAPMDSAPMDSAPMDSAPDMAPPPVPDAARLPDLGPDAAPPYPDGARPQDAAPPPPDLGPPPDCMPGQERACFVGEPEGADVGACGPGLQVCVDEAWGPCEGQVFPAAETCNGRDDDCDGVSDEALSAPCFDGPPVALRGQCREGVQRCLDGVWAVCEGQTLPVPEDCDALDNDCDGRSDEAVVGWAPPAARQQGVCVGMRQSCAGADGWQEPDYGANARYEANERRCDQADNDCDGVVDEGCPVCADGVIQAGETCDHDRPHCVDCQVMPVDVSGGGGFPSGFNAQGFDWYDFTLEGPAEVVLWTEGAGCECAGEDGCVQIDTEIVLYAGDARLQSDDDGGLGLCSRITTRLGPGEYRAEVRGFARTAVPAYVFNALFVPQAPDPTCNGDGVRDGEEECDEPPPGCLDCLVQAVVMPRSGAYAGVIQQGSFDRFRFDLEAAGNVRLETTGIGGPPCPGDTTLSVHALDAEGELDPNLLAFDDDGGLNACSRIDRPYPAGSFEVIVRGFGRAAVPDYELRAEIAGRPPAGDCGNAVVEVDEECDDGNAVDGDACRNTCEAARCGDGVLYAPTEACDDGNDVDGDDCPNDCRSPCRVALGTELCEWPNALSRANSDPWIRDNHADIEVMRPRFLVINFANGWGIGGTDEVVDGLRFGRADLEGKVEGFFTLLREGSRYQALNRPESRPMVEPVLANLVDLQDDSPHANSRAFPRGQLIAGTPGYRTVGYNELFSQQFARHFGRESNGRFLTLNELLALGEIHEIIIIANQVDGRAPNPPDQVTSNILEVAFVAQAYDANRRLIFGEYTKNGVPHERQKVDMARATERDHNSMQWPGRSLRIYFLNASRGPGCLLHSLGHELEFRYNESRIWSPETRHHGEPLNPYMTPLFRRYAGFDLAERFDAGFTSLYSGGDVYGLDDCDGPYCDTLVRYDPNAPQRVLERVPGYRPACGNTHYTPVSRRGYDYDDSPFTVGSVCETFMYPREQVMPLSTGQWAPLRARPEIDNDCGGAFLTYWLQNMPGRHNPSVVNGRPMLNWWPFMYY